MKITTPALLFFFFSVNLLDLFLRIKLLSKIGSTLVDPQQKKKKKKKNSVCCRFVCPYQSVHFRRWGLSLHMQAEKMNQSCSASSIRRMAVSPGSATIFSLWCWVITCLLPWLLSFLMCKVSGIKWDHRVCFLLALMAYDFSSA